jgi:hypothetical protein
MIFAVNPRYSVFGSQRLPDMGRVVFWFVALFWKDSALLHGSSPLEKLKLSNKSCAH